MRRLALTTALTVGTAATVLAAGPAAAEAAVTARLAVQVRCLSASDGTSPSTAGGGTVGRFLLSGTVSGLQPGRSHTLVAGPNPMTYVPLGVANARGTATVGDGRGYLASLRIGRTVGFTVVDDATQEQVGLVTTGRVTADPVCGKLQPGTGLVRGEFTATQQTDGNFVVAQAGVPVWQTGTDGHPGAQTWIQGDGNLVVYAADGRALWQSGTAGVTTRFPGADPRTLMLFVQDDRNLVLYVDPARVVWQAGSYRR